MSEQIACICIYIVCIYICSRPPMIYPAHVSIAMRRVPQDTCELYHKSKRNICMVPVCEFTMFVPLPRHRRRCWRYIMGCVCVWPHIYNIYIILYIYYVYIDILCKWYWGLMDFDCKTWQPWILQHARLGHAVEEAMEVESWDLEPQIHLI